ncbi:hypothetical protein ACX0G9_17055 [Flavitalea flava]
MTITKDILKTELFSGQQQAVELLYSKYSSMLYSYVLQFVPEKQEADNLFVNIFASLAPRLQEACDSGLSIYCWMQVEARKIILTLAEPCKNGATSVSPAAGKSLNFEEGHQKAHYLSLLEEASDEQKWVFWELFICGRQKEELAIESGREKEDINKLLREGLLIIRKKLG